MSSDAKDCTSHWFHTDHFIREYVLIRLTLFKSRYFKFSIDIFIMSLGQIFAEFQFILLIRFRTIFAENETAESAPCVFLYFTKAQ